MDVQDKNGLYYFKYVVNLGILYSKKALKSFACVRNALYEEYIHYEKCIEVPKIRMGVDSISFMGASVSGMYLVVCVCRRNDLIVDSYLLLQVSNIPDLLVLPNMPETRFKQSTNIKNQFEINGLRITVIIPMKQWRIEYNGFMKGYRNPSRMYVINLDVIWTDWSGVITLSEQESPSALAAFFAIKINNWGVTPNILNEIAYHQVGEVLGRVTVNDFEYNICMKSMRERLVSMDKDWDVYYRYATHVISLQNGDFIFIHSHQYLKLSETLSYGYVFRRNLGVHYKINNADIRLDILGVNGKPPDDYSLNFKIGYDISIRVDVYVLDSTELFIGNDWEYRILIRFCRYTVHGITGFGTSEWKYENLLKRQINMCPLHA